MDCLKGLPDIGNMCGCSTCTNQREARAREARHLKRVDEPTSPDTLLETLKAWRDSADKYVLHHNATKNTDAEISARGAVAAFEKVIRHLETRWARKKAKALGYFTVHDLPTFAINATPAPAESEQREQEPAPAAQPPQELVSLREEFKAKADRAYCDYVDQLNRESCLGYEAKLRARKFGHQELDAHKRAAELYGKHLAFTEARAALTRGAVGGCQCKILTPTDEHPAGRIPSSKCPVHGEFDVSR